MPKSPGAASEPGSPTTPMLRRDADDEAPGLPAPAAPAPINGIPAPAHERALLSEDRNEMEEERTSSSPIEVYRAPGSQFHHQCVENRRL